MKNKGVTLLEMILVVAIIGVIFIAIVPFFYTINQSWGVAERKSALLQNARIGLDKINRELKEAKSIVSVTTASDINGHLVYSDQSNNQKEFLRYTDGTNYLLGYVENQVTYPLAGPLDSLIFTCYQADAVTQTINNSEIRNIKIEMILSDDQNKISPQTLSTYVSLRIEPSVITLVINEIMYNPEDSIQGNEDNTYEYIELYNNTDTAIDVAGWIVQGSGSETDIIVGDAGNGTGTTLIPAFGYALITDTDTKIYDQGSPFTVAAAAIKLQVNDTKIISGLNNASDTITLSDSTQTEVDSVTYFDTWGQGASDGNGSSLERISATAPSYDSNNWEDSVLNGTPGFAN